MIAQQSPIVLVEVLVQSTILCGSDMPTGLRTYYERTRYGVSWWL